MSWRESPQPLAAVLFDCDGVLVDSADSVMRCWRRWADGHGFDSDLIAERMHGRRSQDLIADMFPQLDAAAEADAVERAQVEDVGVTAIPGAGELLGSLPAGRYGVVTSGSAQLVVARLGYAGLPQPEVVISADDVTAGKPDPAGYSLAASRLGWPAEQTLAVEDAPAGIAAALAAGMPVAGLTTTHPAAELEAATWVIDGLDELPGLIREADPESPLLG